MINLKSTLAALIAVVTVVASVKPAHAQVHIEIDIDVDSNEMQLAGNAISVKVGVVTIARPFVKMENGSIRIGSDVITSRMNTAKVTGFFPNTKKLVVSEDNFMGTQQYSLNELAVRNGCNGALCVGDEVYTHRANSAKIIGFFANGDIVVAESNFMGTQRLAPENVAAAFGCTALYCAGDQVITSRNNQATVSAFFPNGDILVSESNFMGNQRYSRSDLALTRALCANIYINRVGICQ